MQGKIHAYKDTLWDEQFYQLYLGIVSYCYDSPITYYQTWNLMSDKVGFIRSFQIRKLCQIAAYEWLYQTIHYTCVYSDDLIW